MRLTWARYVTYATLATVAVQNKRGGDHVRIVDNEEGEIEEQRNEEFEDRYSTEYDAIVSHSLERPNSSTSFLRIGTAL